MKKIIFSFILLILSIYQIQAQGGGGDYTFVPPTGTDGAVNAIVVQPDGNIILAGNFQKYGTATVNRIVRILPDNATRDASFDPGAGAGSAIQTCALQPDGKILIGGLFSTYDGVARNKIARLNSNGSLDASFDPGMGTGVLVQSIAVQSDGKILIGGLFTNIDGTPVSNIARLNTDGSIDPTFNQGTGTNDYVAEIELQSDGKILIGGYFTEYNGTARNSIARLNTDGTLDASFDPGSGANELVGAITVLSDNKILIAGEFNNYNGTSIARVARLNTDGSLDATFNPGIGANDFVTSMAIQADHKIVVAGLFTNFNGVSRNRITRLHPDGSHDLTFNPGVGANNVITTCVLQADSMILIGGAFTNYDGLNRKYVARVHDGCGLVFKAKYVSICTGESYVFNGHTYTEAGAYLDTLQSSQGCDSIIISILTVNPAGTFNNPQTICAGNSYTVGSNTYTTTGTYRDTLQNVSGCDSIVVTQLTRIPTTLFSSATICEGNSYDFLDSTYTKSGIYPHEEEIGGCNVTISFTLTVTPAPTSTISQTICHGTSYTVNGHTYTSTGIYRDTIERPSGCDSIVITTLTVTPPTSSNFNKTICHGESYTFNGHTYTVAGIYRDTIETSLECDSIVITTLAVDQPDVSVTQTGNTLSANLTGANYQWLDVDNEYAPILSATGQTYTPLEGGNYAVEIKTTTCMDTSAVYEIVLTDVRASLLKKSIQFSPNPVQDYLEITADPALSIASVNILNASGQVLQTTNLMSVDVSFLSQGMYMLEVETNQGVWREKFVK